MQQELNVLIRQFVNLDDVDQQHLGGNGIKERIMPAFVCHELLDALCQAQLIAKRAQRMLWQVGPEGASQLQGVHPWTKAMPGEGAQEAFFGATAMSHDHGIC